MNDSELPILSRLRLHSSLFYNKASRTGSPLIAMLFACWLSILLPSQLLAVPGVGQRLDLVRGDILRVSNVAELKTALEEVNRAKQPATILLTDGTFMLDIPTLEISSPGLVIRSMNGNREAVIIRGPDEGPNATVADVFLVSANDVVIADLSLGYCRYHGIQIRGESPYDVSGVRVHNCHLLNCNEQFIKGSSSDADPVGATDGCIEQCLFEFTSGWAYQYYTGGIDIHKGVNWIVRDNLFRNLRNPEGKPGIAEHAIHFWKRCPTRPQNIVVERNWILNCDRGIGFGLVNLEGGFNGGSSAIRNNMVFNDGIGSHNDVGIGLEYATDVEVDNNTVFSQSYWAPMEYRFPGSSNLVFRNNLVNAPIKNRDEAVPAIQTSNLEQVETSWFQNLAKGDLHLNAAAIPAINSGQRLEKFQDDMDGRLRAKVKGWDIGAAEFDGEEESWLQERLEWFQDLKFGFMMHWAPYSQWGCIESWPLVEEDKWARPDDLKAWIERDKNMERFTRDYWALPRTFNPQRFDPVAWARAAKSAGMKYVVFTTKHHDGFCLFDTRLTDYRITSQEVPFHSNARSNVVREVFDAFRQEKFGIAAYFSKADWHSTNYWEPTRPARTRNPNYNTAENKEKWKQFVEFTHGQIEELMSGYGAIDILWLDAGQVRPPEQDVQMNKLAAMARGHQPRLLIVDRTVGGRFENYRTPEQEVPEKPLPYVWETCMTMGDQWSFKPQDKYKSTARLIHLLVDVVGKGGNFLLNVGPQPDGQLPPDALSRMKEIGEWLAVNGEAIYGTRPVAPYKDGQVVFTRKGDTVFAIYLRENETSSLPAVLGFTGLKPRPGSRVALLGSRNHLDWQTDSDGRTSIKLPDPIRESAGKYALAFKFEIAGISDLK